MTILSWPFLAFVAGSLAVYYLLPHRAQNVWLLLLSYIFYASWEPALCLLLAATTLINYLLGKTLEKDGNRRRALLWGGIALNILTLASLKMGANGYLMRLLNALAAPAGLEAFNFKILLPLGFSFYVLQAVSYLVDVYRRQMPASRDLLDFAVYMAYFPRMISGPIERARGFLPQLARPRRVDNDTLTRAATLILLGLVRKMILAEGVHAAIQTDFFRRPADFARSDLILALVLYGFWLYNDFAGYSDIVRGISLCFGIELTPNFQQPFLARSFTEFWNRWHISLSHWLRDYVFFPFSRALQRRLPGARRPLNVLLPPLVTMLASGLWHDFGVYMLVWGGLHGLYQAVERAAALLRPAGAGQSQPAWRQTLSRLGVFALVTLAWAPFATGGFGKALQYWQGLFSAHGSRAISLLAAVAPLGFCLVSLLIDQAQYRAGDELVFLKRPRLERAALLAVTLLVFLLYAFWSRNTLTTFIYQGF